MSKITLKNVKSFLRGHKNLYLDKLGKYPKYKQEHCVVTNRCKKCGCATNKKVYDPVSCNRGERFGDMLGENDWNKFKVDNNITIDE